MGDIDPVAAVHALEKDVLRELDDTYGDCVMKHMKTLQKFTPMRPQRKPKPSKSEKKDEEDEEDGEKEEMVEYDMAGDEIRAEATRALGGATVDKLAAQIEAHLDAAAKHLRQHSLKIRTDLSTSEFTKEKQTALERNKDLKDEIKIKRRDAERWIAEAGETYQMYMLAADGKPFDQNMQGAGADAIWAEVFATQDDTKNMANEALEMMRSMNQQSDRTNAEMKRQTEKFKENITKAEEVTEGLKQAMEKLKVISGGLWKDPFFCCIQVVCCLMLGLVILILGGWWKKDGAE